MKTIQLLSKSLLAAQSVGMPATITSGSFKLEVKVSGPRLQTSYTLKFRIEFLPQHIEMLMAVGVELDLVNVMMARLSPNAKRFKSGREAILQGRYAPYYYMGDPANTQTGVCDNWLETDARCTIEVLQKLEAISRDNHLDKICIHNSYVLRKAGMIKDKFIYLTPEHVAQHRMKIEAIRKLVRKRTKAARLPYEISAQKKFNF